MTLTIELTPDLAKRVESAKAQGVDVDAHVRSALEDLPNEKATVGDAPPYSLPHELLETYHALLDKKFGEGPSLEEEADLDRLGAQLDEADSATPLEQANAKRAEEEHERRLTVLDSVMELLTSSPA